MSSPSNDPGPGKPAERRGYHSLSYAAALRSIGRAEPLGATGGHVLVRSIAGSHRHDLSGPYPILACADWTALDAALSALPGDPVCLTAVTDPFCPLPVQRLAMLFDLCRPFHDHALIDLTVPLAPSSHHRRKLRQAGHLRIEIAPPDPAIALRFAELYAHLASRKRITDLRAFSAGSLAAQLAVPGAVLATAWEGATLLGADLYYHEGPVVRAHLSAYSPAGYARAVSYPLMAAAVDHLRPLADVIDLGGAPAVGGDGVAQFKRGWTGMSQRSHLCGRILDPTAYAKLAVGRRTDWFPAYRAGEYATAPIHPNAPTT